VSDLETEHSLEWFANYQQVLYQLHTHLKAVDRLPHPDQGATLRALFQEGKKVIQGQAGRSFGKTELVCYLTWRFALTNPGTETYIICPEIKQAKKIYWYPNRIQNYGPRMFVAEEWESKLQLIFKNGSHIILDGCENYDGLRGIKPKLVIYDEFQHHTKFFDEEVMQPNLSFGDVALIVFGTPPKRDCYYVEFRNTVLEKIAQGNSRYAYFELPTEANPRVDKAWLAEKKADLFAKGKQNIWYREYEGKLLFDTESAIFPMFDKTRHCKPREWIEKRLERDKSKLQYLCVFDPGTATCFAVRFYAINPYTSEMYLLDEIYETRREYARAIDVWNRANEIKERWNDDLSAWTNIYDEAALWFANEVLGEYPDMDGALLPTHKQRKSALTGEDGRPGESIIMSMMLPKGAEQLFFVNDECEKFVWEIENYVKDELGRYPKTNDHLCDTLFYAVLDGGYTVRSQSDPQEEEETQRKSMRAETIQQAQERQRAERNWDSDDDLFYDDAQEAIWQ